MLPDNCEEIFETAYANVRLSSDIVWSAGVPDEFRRTNLDLWFRHITYTSECRNNADNSHSTFNDIMERNRTASDSIPVSCVAQYGNCEYNAVRERLHALQYTASQHHEEFSMPQDKTYPQRDSCEELWMSPAVEEEFRRVSGVDSFENNEL
jgi:uncharacterized protein YeaO (DUF488 family)